MLGLQVGAMTAYIKARRWDLVRKVILHAARNEKMLSWRYPPDRGSVRSPSFFCASAGRSR
jgi:hypothetical protein